MSMYSRDTSDAEKHAIDTATKAHGLFGTLYRPRNGAPVLIAAREWESQVTCDGSQRYVAVTFGADGPTFHQTFEDMRRATGWSIASLRTETSVSNFDESTRW